MAKRILREHKRSSSCSELSDENDIIYDVMSSGEDDEDNPKKNVGNIIKDWLNEDISSPLLPPRIKPLKSVAINKTSLRTFNLFSLSLDKTLQLPIIVVVIDGVSGKDDNNTFAQNEEVLICSKIMTNYVTCVKAEDTDMYNIPINSQYEVTLVNLDAELNKKTHETVKGILGMVRLPNRIIANSKFEINGIKVAENQMLEINVGRRDPNAKYLSVQTLSGEDVELPRNMKVTFSCSISARSLPLTIAIESCIFPQTVILIDKTKAGKVIKKELCTLIDCFSKKMFVACHYKGDVKSSLRGEDTLVELPLNLPLTFRIIGKPEDSNLVFKKLELLFSKSFKIAEDKKPEKSPSPTPLTIRGRSNSTSDLTSYGCKKIYEQRPLKAEKPSTPQPGKSKNLFSKSKDYEVFNHSKTPPLVKPKGNKTKQISDKKAAKKDLVYCTTENLPKLKNNAPQIEYETIQELNIKEKPIEVVNSPASSQLMEENKRLKEKIIFLENFLSEKDIINNELAHKVGLIEVALAEANAINIEHETVKAKAVLAKRILPALPRGGKSAPTSPIGLKEFPNTQSPVTQNPLPLTTKPKLPIKDPHYKSPKDYPREPPKQTESEYSDTVHNTSTTHYLAFILEKVNFGQYKDTFLREGINAEILAELDERILENDLGIKTALHRRKLIKLAEKLKNKEDISSFYVDPQHIYGSGKNVLYEKIN